MPEPGDTERDAAIDRPPIYRTLLIAFIIWMAHFTISYGAVLIFPENGIARIIAILACITALALLFLQSRKLSGRRSPLALGALGLAGAGIIFGTFPAIIG